MKYVCSAPRLGGARSRSRQRCRSAAPRMASGRRGVHAGHDAHRNPRHRTIRTFVLRQNPCVDYEANLVYLCWERSARCSSTPAPWKVRKPRALAGLVWLAARARGRGQVAAARGAHPWSPGPSRRRRRRSPRSANTVIAPIESAALRQVLGFNDWPNGLAQIDLGGRIIDLIPTPGHHEDHIVFYDRKSQTAVHRGFPAAGAVVSARTSMLTSERAARVGVREDTSGEQVLGAHIELDITGTAVPGGATFHPNERVRCR